MSVLDFSPHTPHIFGPRGTEEQDSSYLKSDNFSVFACLSIRNLYGVTKKSNAPKTIEKRVVAAAILAKDRALKREFDRRKRNQRTGQFDLAKPHAQASWVERAASDLFGCFLLGRHRYCTSSGVRHFRPSIYIAQVLQDASLAQRDNTQKIFGGGG